MRLLKVTEEHRADSEQEAKEAIERFRQALRQPQC